MIQVTLQFTSIDAAVKALRSLPEVELVGQVQPGPAVDKVKSAPQPPAEKTASATKAAPAPTSPSAAAAPVDAAPAADLSTKPDLSGPIDGPGYKLLKDAVFKLAGMSRPAIEAINAQFEVKTMRDLAEDKRNDALDAINEKIAELAKKD